MVECRFVGLAYARSEDTRQARRVVYRHLAPDELCCGLGSVPLSNFRSGFEEDILLNGVIATLARDHLPAFQGNSGDMIPSFADVGTVHTDGDLLSRSNQGNLACILRAGEMAFVPSLCPMPTPQA